MTTHTKMVNGKSVLCTTEEGIEIDARTAEFEAAKPAEAKNRKTQEIKGEADRRISLISSPRQTLKKFNRAIKAVYKVANGTAGQGDIDYLEDLIPDSDAAEAIDDAEVAMLVEINALATSEAVGDYPVKDNELWP